MEAKITKKQFEEKLNEKFGFNNQAHGNTKQRATKRPYGTYYRQADLEFFNMWYEKYLKTGIL